MKNKINIILWIACILIFFGTLVPDEPTLGFQSVPNTYPIRDVIWSPDGTKIALGGGPECDRDNPTKFVITILDASTQQVVRTLQGHTCTVTSLAWSPDGSKIASSSGDGTARVWNTASGQLITTTQAFAIARGKLAWSPDGTKIANVWIPDRRFEIWDAANGQTISLFDTNDGISRHLVSDIAWSPDGTKIASNGRNTGVIIWNSMTGQVLTTIGAGQGGFVQSVVWNFDGTQLATANDDSTIRVWSAATGQNLLTIQSHASEIRWNPSGTALAGVIWEDTKVIIWDTRTGQQLSLIQSSGVERVIGIAWKPDGSKLISIGSNTNPQGQNLQIVPAPPVWIITVPPRDNFPITSADETRFQAIAYDPTVGISNGAGISQVEFEIRTPANSILYSFTDTTPGYCAFGGDTTCNIALGSITGAAAGTYTLRMRARLSGGTYTEWISRPFVLLDNSQIVFSTQRDGNDEIYLMHSNGSNPANRSNNSNSDINPVWKPDRSKIAFASNRDGNYELYVMNADGTGQTRLTTATGNDGNPAWSPDGTRIAFVSERDGNKEIYLYDATTGVQTRLTNNTAEDATPNWSPDGTKIVFTSTRDGNAELYTMNTNGTSVTRLTTNAAVDVLPVWSPDGTKIAFASNRDGDYEVWLMNADGSSPVQVTTNTASDGFHFVSATVVYGGISWSADGTQLVFISNRDGNIELYRLNANATQIRLTTNTFVDTAPDG